MKKSVTSQELVASYQDRARQCLRNEKFAKTPKDKNCWRIAYRMYQTLAAKHQKKAGGAR